MENRLKAVCYYVDDRGDNPVKEFIESLSLAERAKVLAYINELKKQGNNLRRPMADYLEDGIYELRPKNNRIFYFFYLRDNAVILHAIKKKTREIPGKDLNLCLKRKNLIEKGYGYLEKLELRGDLNEES
ncbi:MAG: type II toxin-antitoxin system RelE/ParE family toxin [Candidatus Omnitrophota bacterium]